MAGCPRCSSGCLATRYVDSTFHCLLCGYEVVTIPQDVLDEVEKSMGKRKLYAPEAKLPGENKKSKVRLA